MSTGHLEYVKKRLSELYQFLGSGDTPKLYARRPHINFEYDIAYAAGNSLDGKTVYIDRQLYRDIKSGKVKVAGLAPEHLIELIVTHEHTEWSIASGDNPVDNYRPAHEFANTREIELAKRYGASEERYNHDWGPPLKACMARFLKTGRGVLVPRDLWCGPYVDEAYEGDGDAKKVLSILRAKHVTDADKVSKMTVNYGVGEQECRNCTMFCGKGGPIGLCDLVNGPIRTNRWCKRWVARKGYDNG